MQITVRGNLLGGSKAFLTSFENRIVDARKQVAAALTDALLANMPVWSGRTVRSLQWSNDGSVAPREGHPDRGDLSTDGKFKYHSEFGHTSLQGLGEEQMRGGAEATARGTLGNVDYAIDNQVTVTISSVPWPLVEQAQAPTAAGARNTAVVSQIAMGAIKSMFGFLKQ